MKQSDQELLLKGLCMMAPYHVKLQVSHPVSNCPPLTTDLLGLDLENNYVNAGNIWRSIREAKPYLRAIEDLTPEEEEKIQSIYKGFKVLGWPTPELIEIKSIVPIGLGLEKVTRLLQLLNEFHIDYMGFIERGLAIRVTKENNPYASTQN